MVAYAVAVGRHRRLRLVDALVTFGHLQGPLSAFVAFLGRCSLVGTLKLRCGIVVFPYGEIFLALLQVLLGTARRKDHSRCDHGPYI